MSQGNFQCPSEGGDDDTEAQKWLPQVKSQAGTAS